MTKTQHVKGQSCLPMHELFAVDIATLSPEEP